MSTIGSETSTLTSTTTSTGGTVVITSHGGPGGDRGGGTGPPGITPSSSLLFGFLVTFLALFVAFMACGLGSRRARDLRRRLYENSQMGLTRPEFWDVWIDETKSKNDNRNIKWQNMQPLAAAFKRPQTEPDVPTTVTHQPNTTEDTATAVPPITYFSPAYNSRPTQTVTYTPTPIGVVPTRATITRVPTVPQVPLSHRYPLPQASLPSVPERDTSWLYWLPESVINQIEMLRRRRRGSKANTEDDKIEGMQVSVLIAMPTPPVAKVNKMDACAIVEEQISLPSKDYVVGVAEVPWKHKSDLS